MILVTIGTQNQKFDRLFEYIDNLKTKDEIIVQSGKNKYNFKNENIRSYDFFNIEEMARMIDSADLIITHGGGGTIFKALEKGKKVIVVPRLKKYKEHINDHQLEVSNYLLENNYVMVATNEKEFKKCFKAIKKHKFTKYKNNINKFQKDVEKEINDLLNC